MSAVILQPHSLTNPSGNYRVVDYGRWLDHVNGNRASVPVIGEYKSYAEAEKARNEV